MRSCYLVTGSNAGGKTTLVTGAIREWQTDDRVLSIDADSDKTFKGTPEEQIAAVSHAWSSPALVVIFTGTRLNVPVLRVARMMNQDRHFAVVIVLQQPKVMKAHLQMRCERAGKTFREDFWTHRVLEYEGMRRYPNAVRNAGFRPVVVEMDEGYIKATELAKLLRDSVAVAVGDEKPREDLFTI